MSEEEDLEALILGQILAEEKRRIRTAQDLEKVVAQNKKLGFPENAKGAFGEVVHDANKTAPEAVSAARIPNNDKGESAEKLSLEPNPAPEQKRNSEVEADDGLLGKIAQGDNVSGTFNLAVPPQQNSSSGSGVVGRAERRREKSKTGQNSDIGHKNNKDTKETENTILGFEIDNGGEEVVTTTKAEYELYEVPAAPPRIHSSRPDKPDKNSAPEKKVKKRERGKASVSENRAHKRKLPYAPNTFVSKLFQVLLAVCLPIIIVWLAFRLVASSLFASLEFLKLGPAQGLEPEVRQRFADYALGYLFSNADRSYLEDLRLGEDPAFTPNEISHMADVKNIITVLTYVMFLAAVIAIICVIVLIICDRRARDKNRVGGAVRRAFFYGAILTVVLVAFVVSFVLLNWDGFFTGFHESLFPQGNWQFDADTLLIRVFPERFWYDAAFALCILSVLTSLVIIASNWPRKKKAAGNSN